MVNKLLKTGLRLSVLLLFFIGIATTQAQIQKTKRSDELYLHSSVAENRDGPVVQVAGIVLQFRSESVLAAMSAAARERVLSDLLGIRVASAYEFDRYISFTFDHVLKGNMLQTIVQTLNKHADIESAELDFVGESALSDYANNEYRRAFSSASTGHSDEKLSNQWYLSSPYHSSVLGINVQRAWNYSVGEGVVVAVIDSGVTSHPGLSSKILPGVDLVSNHNMINDGDGVDADASDPGDNTEPGSCRRNVRTRLWHGTAVASLIAGNYEVRTEGFSGVAPGANILPIRGLGRCGRGTLMDWVLGIYWALGEDISQFGDDVSGVPVNPYPAKVVNLSATASTGHFSACPTYMQAAIDQGIKRGVSFVVSAGNGAVNTARVAPANCSGVIVVGASNKNGVMAAYSNFGEQVDVLAPGGHIVDFNGDGRINGSDAKVGGIVALSDQGDRRQLAPSVDYFSGTSMSAPMVAGVVALMYAINPRLDAGQVEMALKQSVSPFSKECVLLPGSQLCGEGVIDAEHALIRISANKRSRSRSF